MPLLLKTSLMWAMLAILFLGLGGAFQTMASLMFHSGAENRRKGEILSIIATGLFYGTIIYIITAMVALSVVEVKK